MHIGAWARYFSPKNQNQRELLIAVDKIQRLWWQNEFHFMNCLESIERSKKFAQKKSKIMGLEYEKIVQRVEQAFKDIAQTSSKPMSPVGLNELMYGNDGVLTTAVEYGRRHAN
jgi:hypothetical protein